MKKLFSIHFLLFIIPLLFITSCAKPYQASLFREVQIAGNYFNSVRSLGVALYQKKELTDSARKAIKIALDEQAKAHAIAVYSIEEYQRFSGVLGSGGTEQSLTFLLNKSAELKSTIERYLGAGTGGN